MFKMPIVPDHTHDDENIEGRTEISNDLAIGVTPYNPGLATGQAMDTSSADADNTICFAEFLGKLFAGTSNGKIYVEDGTGWVLVYTSASTSIGCLCVFEDNLYAGGTSGELYVTENGADFSLAATIHDGEISALFVHDGRLFAGVYKFEGYEGICYSWDGVNWSDDALTGRIIGFAEYFYSFYAADDAGVIYQYDGSAWSNVFDLSVTLYSFYRYNNLLFAGGANGKIYRTGDPTTSFGEIADIGAGNITALIEYQGALYAAMGTEVYYSDTDSGVTWYLADDLGDSVYSFSVYSGCLYCGTSGSTPI